MAETRHKKIKKQKTYVTNSGLSYIENGICFPPSSSSRSTGQKNSPLIDLIVNATDLSNLPVSSSSNVGNEAITSKANLQLDDEQLTHLF